MAAVVTLAAAGVLAVGGTAYGVASGAFFQTAMGDHGMGQETNWSHQWKEGGETYRYVRQYQTVNPEDVSDDLANAIEPVGYTIENCGYTLAVENMVADENGCGIVQFTVSNPDGINIDTEGSQTNQLFFKSSDPNGGWYGIAFEDLNDDGMNYRVYYDSETATNTEVHATMYFTPSKYIEGALDAGVRWGFTDSSGDPKKTVWSDTFTPSKLVGTRTFSDGAQAKVSLSPFSICYRANEVQFTADDGTTRYAEFVAGDLTLHKADGTDYRIKGSTSDGADIVNDYVSTLLWDGNSVSVFTQLIDTGKVTGVTMTGHQDGTDLAMELTPVE